MAFQEIMKGADVLVRVMELAHGAATPWHHHSAVTDFFVCLTGVIAVERRDPAARVVLHPGQRAEVRAPEVHRVVNLSDQSSEYLLVQGIGGYDFIENS